ncbi:MAG TPA: DUF423 domain-containing protein [Candidatus Eisenbacteria bacterium]|nr:DUF423 domain-containing protein [Candidatus Eisenbacteria bacterium]
MKSPALFGVLGAVFGFLGVAAGAFGAHALRDTLPPDRLQVFETGARYQLIHALALIAVALALDRAASGALTAAGWLLVLGQVIFAGSLYALALSGVRLWGAVTPLGGLCYLVGWILLAIAFAKR